MEKTKITSATITLILALTFAALVVNIPGVAAEEDQEWTLMYADHARKGFQEGPAPNTPHLLWKTEPLEGVGPPAWGLSIAEGKVIRGHYDTGDVFAWDVNTGDVLWHRSGLNHTTYGVHYYDGKIYCAAMSKTRTMANVTGDMWMCLDAATGKTIWRWKIPETINGVPQIIPIPPDGYLSVYPSQSTVYRDKLWIRIIGGFAILDPDTGGVLNYTINGASVFFPAFVEDYHYGATGQIAYAMNVDTLEMEWTTPIRLGGNHVAVSGVYLYVSGSDGNLTKIDRRDGQIVWEMPWTARTDEMSKFTNPITPPPVVAYERVFLAGFEGNIYGIDAPSGTAPVWTFETGGLIYANPVVADEKFFGGSSDGYIYCLTLTGELVWKYYAGDVITDCFAIVNGKLFASSSDGTLYCFGPAEASSMSISLPTTITVGDSLAATGTFVDEAGNGISGESVTLRYRVAPSTEWKEITTLTTASDGSYSYTWTPPYDGYYDIRASYLEPEIGGYAAADATSTVRVAGTAPEVEVEVDLTPVTGAISELEGSIDDLESATSALTTYLIAIVVLVIISIVAIVYIAYRSRK